MHFVIMNVFHKIYHKAQRYLTYLQENICGLRRLTILQHIRQYILHRFME